MIIDVAVCGELQICSYDTSVRITTILRTTGSQQSKSFRTRPSLILKKKVQSMKFDERFCSSRFEIRNPRKGLASVEESDCVEEEGGK